VTVHREEHFRGYNVSLSCSGRRSSIRTCTIMAVLDASTVNSSDSRLIQRHTMALVNMSAHLISRWNFLNEYSESWILRFHSRPEFVGLLHEALVAMDDGGQSWRSTKRDGAVGLFLAQVAGRAIDREYFQFSFGTLEQRAKFEPTRSGRCATGARPALLRHRARPPAPAAPLRMPDAVDAADAPERARDPDSSMWSKTRKCARTCSAAGSYLPSRCPSCCRARPHGQGGVRQGPAVQRLVVRQALRDRHCAAIPEPHEASVGYTRALSRASKDGRMGKICSPTAAPCSSRDRRHAIDAADTAAACDEEREVVPWKRPAIPSICTSSARRTGTSGR